MGPYVVIGEDVTIGDDATIHAHVVIYQGAKIGNSFQAHSHVAVREFCRIGDRVVLQNGALIGTDGFGFARRPDGYHQKIVQSGIVVIEDDVEIQAHACIDRAAVGETRIKRGAIIDNLVQIGHAVEVGEKTILCAQVGIAGSTKVGDNCILAGQVGLINHLTIGDNVQITAQTGVAQDVPSGSKISGSPAIDNRLWLKSSTVFARLPDLEKSVRSLNHRLEDLEKK
jgi:UDP-3-O-[3-hydroxymyristoyl] glucosamine N-acyltransferase